MIEKLKDMIGQKVERLLFIVWPPFGESSMGQVDISAGYIFEKDSKTIRAISTDKNDLTKPCVFDQHVPKKVFAWDKFKPRLSKWMDCSNELEMDTEYYEATHEPLFKSIVKSRVLDIELVTASKADGPIGIKVVFANDYILSTPIDDGNTIETNSFNKNNNLDHFQIFGNIVYQSIISPPLVQAN